MHQDRTFAEYFAEAINRIKRWDPAYPVRSEFDIQVIDLFCGCGGMSLGFTTVRDRDAGFEIVGGIDVDRSSLATYARNFKVPAICADVREMANSDVTYTRVLSCLPTLNRDKPLVLIGCAPCQGFTGHRKAKWDIPDERNNLIAAFAEVATKLRPEFVVVENVPELLSNRYWPYFASFKKKLESNGYRLSQTILNAAEYGVPQERFRAVAVASRTNSFCMPTALVGPRQFTTVKDAIGDLPPVRAGETLDVDPMHRSAAHRPRTIQVIRAIPKDGGSRAPGIGPKCLDKVNGYYDVYGRLHWDKPSITITHYSRNPASGRFIHPEQDRGLTKREAARLQSFPDGFMFEGTFDDVFRQIGEAVPPFMAAAIASAVMESARNESAGSVDNNLITVPVNDSYSGVIAGIKLGRL